MIGKNGEICGKLWEMVTKLIGWIAMKFILKIKLRQRADFESKMSE